MTLDEALRELGLDAEATPDQIRRAYARGVKTRKPEVAPDGFRRLREAYEIAAQRRGQTIESQEQEEAEDAEDAGQPEDVEGEVGPSGAQGSGSGSPPLVDALRHLLELQANGEVTESREALGRLRTQVEAWGGEISLFSKEQMQLLWSLTQEMVALPEIFPMAVRQAFARALLAGDPAAAEPDLRALAESDPGLADKALFQLRLSKGLGNIFRSMLLPAHTTPPLPVWSKTNQSSTWMILWAILIVGLIATHCPNSASPSESKRTTTEAPRLTASVPPR